MNQQLAGPAPTNSTNNAAPPTDFEKSNEIGLDQTLTAALSGVTARQFAAACTDQSHPTVLLSLADETIGGIGLPLSSRDGASIAASFTPTEGPLVIDTADSLLLNQDQWDQWLHRIAEVLLTDQLGLGKDQWDLRQECLVLANEGDLFDDSEVTSISKIGSLLILLPTFVPYELKMWHTGTSDSLKLIANSPSEAGIAAWYQGAEHSFHSEGFVLGLRYSIEHTGDGQCPTIPNNMSILPILRNMLLYWGSVKDTEGDRKGTLPDTMTLTSGLDETTNLPEFSPIANAQAAVIIKAAEGLPIMLYKVHIDYIINGRALEKKTYDAMPNGGSWYMMAKEDRRDKLFLSQWQTLNNEPIGEFTAQLDPRGAIIPMLYFSHQERPNREGFNEKTGELIHQFKRAGMVMWPKGSMCNSPKLALLLGYNGAFFLPDVHWKSITDGHQAQLEYAKLLIGTLPHWSAELDPDRKRISILLKAVIEWQRYEFLLAIIEKTTIEAIEDEYLPAIVASLDPKVVYEVLSPWINMGGQPVHTCFGKRVLLLGYIFSGDRETLRKKVEDLILFTVPRNIAISDMVKTCQVLGAEVFYNVILSRIQAYHDSAYWVALLFALQANKDTQVPLPFPLLSLLVHAHVPVYNIRDGNETFSNTVGLLSICLEKGQTALGTELLDKLATGINFISQSMPDGSSNSVYSSPFVYLIDGLLKALGPYSIEAHGHAGLMQTIMLRHILPALGPHPPPMTVESQHSLSLPGLSHQCLVCDQISAFLKSPVLERKTWPIDRVFRDGHISEQLNVLPNIESSWKGLDNNTTVLLTVWKLAHQMKVQQANAISRWETDRGIVCTLMGLLAAVDPGPLWQIVGAAVDPEAGQGWTKDIALSAMHEFNTAVVETRADTLKPSPSPQKVAANDEQPAEKSPNVARVHDEERPAKKAKLS